jgi:outer membrane beta-barrel protein
MAAVRAAAALLLGSFALAAAAGVAMAAASDKGDKGDKADKADGDDDDEAPPKPGADACIDEDVKADLFAKRKQRTSRDRLFQQTNRHELTLIGGYYSSDLFDGVYYTHLRDVPYVARTPYVGQYIGAVPLLGTFGFAYAYHMTEDLAVEASAAFTRLSSSGGPELERTFAVLQDRPRHQLMFDADLVWSFAHAKMRFGGSITHFDFYVAAGAGVVDSVISSHTAGNGGFGVKFFLGHAFAFRIDVRDRIFQQQLLSETMLVNDISSTLGLSIYLPMRE